MKLAVFCVMRQVLLSDEWIGSFTLVACEKKRGIAEKEVFHLILTSNKHLFYVIVSGCAQR